MKVRSNNFLSAMFVGVSCLGAMNAGAVTVLVDFGTEVDTTSTEDSARTWNNATTDGNVANLVTTAGGSTGFGLAFTGTAIERVNAAFTESGEVASRVWPTSATEDLLNVAGTMSFKISNLDPNVDYTIDIYSGRFGGDNTTRGGDYTIEGAGTAFEQLDFNAFGNTGALVSTTLKPDALGDIEVTISPDNGHTYINVLQISYVPEPSAALLSCIGLSGFLLRRRR